MNIFVIEDEPPILREIIAIINSFHEDYQIIGKAQNGQEAMDFLQSQGERIDVMITDIQVPVINGLELIEYTHSKLPHILSIILTGFSNFDYAQKAIRYGVFDYLLKPIDEDELHKQLQKAYAQKCLDYIHNRPDEVETPRTHTSASHDSSYQIALLSISSFPMYASSYNELFPSLWKKTNLSELFEKYTELKDHYWIIDGLTLAEKIVLFLPPDGAGNTDTPGLSEVLQELTQKDFTITIAIDTHPHGIRNIHQAILDLRSFLNRQVHLEHSSLLFYEKDSMDTGYENYEKTITDFHPYHMRLSGLFIKKNLSLFDAELYSYIKAIKKQELPTVILYRILQEFLHTCIAATDDVIPPAALDVQTTVGDILMLSDSYKSLYENLKSIFSSLLEFLLKEEKMPTEKSNILIKIDAYMKENYTHPINTKSIAEQFGFTPAYLSKIFREYKDITPADYIIQLRIDKAKELFTADPYCKIKDVAAFVGYEDSLYFSKVFKKLTGMSPKQFLECHCSLRDQ